MFFILSKLLALFTVPSNLIGLAILLGLALVVLRWRKAGALLLVAANLSLLAIGWSPLGSIGLVILENRFPLPVLKGEVAGIVVLGGAIDTEVSQERQTIALGDPGERLTKTAQLSALYPQARIVLAGGLNDLMAKEGRSEAALARDLLVEIGVPAGRIELEERSRNTCENAVDSKAVAAPRPGENWLLITSAFHMPRAVGCFRAAGFAVTPYPVDYFVRLGDLRQLSGSLSVGLYLADLAAHEWLGLIAYSLAKGTELFPHP